MGGVWSEAEDDALAGGEEGAAVPEPLQAPDAVRGGAGGDAVHWQVNIVAELEQVQRGVVNTSLGLDTAQDHGPAGNAAGVWHCSHSRSTLCQAE